MLSADRVTLQCVWLLSLHTCSKQAGWNMKERQFLPHHTPLKHRHRVYVHVYEMGTTIPKLSYEMKAYTCPNSLKYHICDAHPVVKKSGTFYWETWNSKQSLNENSTCRSASTFWIITSNISLDMHKMTPITCTQSNIYFQALTYNIAVSVFGSIMVHIQNCWEA